jgi:pimeloyl-ACP methyl ester carboxylesterase
VLLHGASSNLRAMQHPLGDRLASTRRVILIDRPGHGWSERDRVEDSTPELQGRMIIEALTRLGIDRVILVAHSWAGALALRMALDDPERVAGLVLLAPVAYPWKGGVGRYSEVISTPLIGPLLAYTITLPLGYLFADSGARGVFAPQSMPDDFVRVSATPLLLRPREFIANARDLVTLKAAVVAQAPCYAEIEAPISIISGDADDTVWTKIHSRPLAAAAPNARLVVLPGVGHMVQQAATDLVISEIETMADRMALQAMTAQ